MAMVMRKMVPDLLAERLQRLLDRDVVLDAKERRERANDFFKARNATEVTNLMGLILEWQPLKDANADNIAKMLLFDEADCKKYLQPVVARMRSSLFNCLPMMMVTEKNGSELTWLVRAYCSAEQQIDYIDMSLRRYESFEQFLASNRLPACKLYYPRQGIVQYDKEGRLLVDCRTIKPESQLLRDFATAASVGALGLTLTPLIPAAVAVMAAGMTIPSLGFAISDFVDGVKHEKTSIVFKRATLLTVNVMSFAQVGLFAGCKVARLRGLLSADKLKLLETTEKIVRNINKFVSPMAIGICTLLVSRSDWDRLSNQDKLMLAANLCLAYRELVSLDTAQRLIRLCNVKGLVQFYQTSSPNLKIGNNQLCSMIEPFVEPMMRFMMDCVKKNILITTDDHFTTITVFNYKLSIPTLFSLDQSLLLELNDQLHVGYMAAQHTIKSVKECMRTTNLLSRPGLLAAVVHSVLDLCKVLVSLPNAAIKLGDAIKFGKGHEFTQETLLAWWNAPTHDRRIPLRALLQLDGDQTMQLNQLRSSGRLKDKDLFHCLAVSSNEHKSNEHLLAALLDVAKRMPKLAIVFDDQQRIVISELLAIDGSEYNAVPSRYRDVLLHDHRFLQLCRDASTDESLHMLKLGREVWVRTCSYKNPQFETIELMSSLFEAGRLPLTLAQALDYTITSTTDNTVTVAKVYYGTLFACQKLNWTGNTEASDEQLATLRAGFAELVNQVQSKYRMACFKRLSIPEKTSDGGLSDESVIALARTLLSSPDEDPSPYYRNPAPSVPFGPAERAALWLHFVPALRHPDARQQILTTITDLLANGEARLMVDESNGTVRRDTDGAYMVMFYRNAARVMVELIPHTASGMRGSIYLCSTKAMFVKWNPKPAPAAPEPGT
ncbi:hypothetical protein AND_005948 [Anopheles darlingi]|uniref:DUF4781 domain-containing protein n=1 Tax=Anopheles darlingi TaxID=43151 RepID=W5JHR4_ANODA|nr:hypothetical protein AND_005948 [Anopheles darlingi]